MTFVRSFLLVLCAAGAIKAFAQRQPVADLQVLWTPEPTVIGGKRVAYYELRIVSQVRDSLTLKALKIVSSSDHSVVASFDADELTRRFRNVDGSAKEKRGVLNPDGTGVIYLEVALPQIDGSLHLVHQLDVIAGNGPTTFSLEGGKIQSPKKPPLVIGMPLQGGPWVAIYEASWERGHRRVMFTTDGEQHIPGRFAIDFIMADQQGRFSNGNSDSTRNWYGYSAPVLAASDGVVVATRTDFMESLTLSAHPDYPASRATGNYIAIALDKNHVLFYEHLKPGSIVVKSGQRVKKGDVIAAIGFTGQTTGPHLHLHLADRNSPLGAEGIPFAIDAFTLLGVYSDPAALGLQPWTPLENKKIVKEHPGPNTVIMFQP